MNQRRSAFIHSPELEAIPYPEDCPFTSSRAGMTRRTLESMGLLSSAGRSVVPAPPAGEQALLRFHTPDYLRVLRDAQEGRLEPEGLHMGLGTPDCPVFRGMFDYAALACGATLRGADLLLNGEADVAFNPSGGYHHAHAERAAGFCYLNDVVLGCFRMADAGRRVMFVDVDAHHCDGVQAACYGRSDIMTVSFHQSGLTLFPGTGFTRETGAAGAEGLSVNLPLPVGTYDSVYLRAFRELVPPLFEAFAPDVLVLELGMDGLAGDPLAGLRLTNNCHAAVVEALLGFNRPLLVTGGGGYHPENTARGWALCWSLMCGAGGGEELGLGLGGVMLESSEWQGGLRDRQIFVDEPLRSSVEAEVLTGVSRVREMVFPLHGLQP